MSDWITFGFVGKTTENNEKSFHIHISNILRIGLIQKTKIFFEAPPQCALSEITLTFPHGNVYSSKQVHEMSFVKNYKAIAQSSRLSKEKKCTKSY